MDKAIFFLQNKDIPRDYIEYVVQSFLSQIGQDNFAVLGLESGSYGVAELNSMRGAGCILRFAEPVDGCRDLAMVLFCDLYQIASGTASVDEDGHTCFDIKKFFPNTDIFSLADVIGEIRGVKLRSQFTEPMVAVSSSPDGDTVIVKVEGNPASA